MLTATIYKTVLDISDLDRGYYASHSLTIARHPSETQGRLMVRVLAFALFASERLAFGRGLAAEDEAALWELNDAGEIERWIDVGLPDNRRLRRAAGRSEDVVVLAYDEAKFGPWWQGNRADFAKIPKLSVYLLDDETLKTLERLADRFMQLTVTVQDGILWVADDQETIEIAVKTIMRQGREIDLAG